MRRYCLSLACAALVTFLAPHPSEAAIIQCADAPSQSCEPIGFFSWDVFGFVEEDIFVPIDDLFTISNVSDGIDSPATGAFSDVTVTVDPGVCLGCVARFGTIGAGGQLDFPTQDLTLSLALNQAHLSFLFQSVRFELTLTAPETQVPIYATTVVPEPASLLLLASGTVMLGLATRRRRSR